MDNKNGHWYTDKNGNHYFVENGQTPKEGWEASKRRKMISGGKYQVDDGDGKGPREVAKDEYDKYEADLADFDSNQEDDFGFDEKGDSEYYDDIIAEMRENGVDIGDQKAVMGELSSNYNMDDGERKAFMEYAFGGFDEPKEAERVKEKFADRFTEEEMDAAAERVSRKHGMSKEKAKEMLFGGEEIEEESDFEDEGVSDEKISETLGDYSWQITDDTTVGDYAKDVAEMLGCSKERVLDVIRSDDPSISEDDLMSGVAGLEDEEEYDFEDEVEEIVDRLKNESGMYYDARSFAEQKLKDYSPKAREEALRRFQGGSDKGGSDEDERLRRIVDERVKQGWDQKGTHDAQSIKDTGYLGFGSLDALEKATFGDKEGTNGWKPSEEATPAYDAGGFYSINEGDEWDFQDGGYIKVEKVNGDKITIRTPGGNRETITKDELSERVKHASKVPASGANPFYKQEPDYYESGDEKTYKPEKEYSIYGEELKGNALKRMQDLKSELDKLGLSADVKNVWQDYGAGIRTTNLISDDTQVLTPREWSDYMNGKHTPSEMAEKIAKKDFWSKRIKGGKNPNDSSQSLPRSDISKGAADGMANRSGVKVSKNDDGTLTISGNDSDIDQFMEMYNKWLKGKK